MLKNGVTGQNHMIFSYTCSVKFSWDPHKQPPTFAAENEINVCIYIYIFLIWGWKLGVAFSIYSSGNFQMFAVWFDSHTVPTGGLNPMIIMLTHSLFLCSSPTLLVISLHSKHTELTVASSASGDQTERFTGARMIAGVYQLCWSESPSSSSWSAWTSVPATNCFLPSLDTPWNCFPSRLLPHHWDFFSFFFFFYKSTIMSG